MRTLKQWFQPTREWFQAIWPFMRDDVSTKVMASVILASLTIAISTVVIVIVLLPWFGEYLVTISFVILGVFFYLLVSAVERQQSMEDDDEA